MILILDTETTGITPQDRIVSISWGCYNADGGLMVNSHHIVRPDGFLIPSAAAAVHKITTEQARRCGVALAGVLRELEETLARYRPQLYVGHNVAFDRPIVLNEYSRVQMSESLSRLPTVCTMKEGVGVCRIPRSRGGGFKWPKLAELHRQLFGSVHQGAHDAKGDVEATARCFFEMRRRGYIRWNGTESNPGSQGVEVRVVACPSCGQRLRFKSHGETLRLRCPACRKEFQSP